MKYLALALSLLLPSVCSAQVMNPDLVARWRAVMPWVSDRGLQKALADPATMFYTEREMPPAFQFSGQVFSTYAHINALPDPHGNANREFPWLKPAGTDNVRNLATVRFLNLPRREDGSLYPVAYYVGPLPSPISNDSQRVSQWIFPKGAILGEVLCLRSASGVLTPFEIRTRTKESDRWEVDVFRPFPTKQHLASRLRELGEDALAEQVEGKLTWVAKPTVDRQALRAIFREPQAAVEMLPQFNAALTDKLLGETTFRSSAGAEWDRATAQNGSTTVCYAPTSQQDYSIVPAGYSGGVVNVTNQSCTRCHSTTLNHANTFAVNGGFNPARGTREWYGRVRGSDGIFSFHPFDPGVIGNVGGPPRIRQSLVQSGIVASYERVRDPSVYYKIPEYDPARIRSRNQGMVVGGLVVPATEASYIPEKRKPTIVQKQVQPLPSTELYYFTAKWCHYCQQMRPTVEAAKQAGYPIKIVDVDTQQGQQLVRALGLPQFWPTTVIARRVTQDNQQMLIPVSVRKGLMSSVQFRNFVRAHYPPKPAQQTQTVTPGPE